MRSTLLSLLQPRFDAMRDEVLDVLEERIIALGAQAANAFESALLTALSDVSAEGGADVEAAPNMPPAREQRTVDQIRAPRPKLVRLPRKSATRQAGAVDEKPAPAPKVAHCDVKPANVSKPAKPPRNGARICGKCGTEGHYARTCRRELAAPAATPKPDRIAALRDRQAARLPDPPVARVGDDELDVDEEDLDVAIGRAERKKKRGTLPEPRSTFHVDRGEVAELDFGGDHG